ncbi:putative uncharacterized protein [Pseudomonas sp. StFLB209]|nr:putative uncharacterized protein [Pseudomonas sp. StFLB209]
MRQTIDTHDFLGRTIELEQTLTDFAIKDPVPDAMGREATVTLVDEGPLKALLLLGLRKTLEQILRIVSIRWNG